eukprot:COSAG04_NODE_8413_length_979_cov_1.848864_2_plen_138_part_01
MYAVDSAVRTAAKMIYPDDGVVTRALRSGDYKLLEGYLGPGEWWPADLTTTDGRPETLGDGPRLDEIAKGEKQGERKVRLFNVVQDPTESVDLSEQMPELVSKMRARLDEAEQDAVESHMLPHRLVDGFQAREMPSSN